MIMQHQAFSALSQKRNLCMIGLGEGAGRWAGDWGKEWGDVRWVAVWVLSPLTSWMNLNILATFNFKDTIIKHTTIATNK